MAPERGRSGVLVLRAWLEGGAGHQLRARITESRDLADLEQLVTTTTSVDEIVSTVQNWLSALVGGTDADRTAVNGSTLASAGRTAASALASSVPTASGASRVDDDLHSARTSQPEVIVGADGTNVQVLIRGTRGSLALTTLPAGHAAVAVRHASAEQLRYAFVGEGELWRRRPNGHDVGAIVPIRPGAAVRIQPGSDYQFRAHSGADLVMVAVALRDDHDLGPQRGRETHRADGPWTPTLAAGPHPTWP